MLTQSDMGDLWDRLGPHDRGVRYQPHRHRL